MRRGKMRASATTFWLLIGFLAVIRAENDPGRETDSDKRAGFGNDEYYDEYEEDLGGLFGNGNYSRINNKTRNLGDEKEEEIRAIRAKGTSGNLIEDRYALLSKKKDHEPRERRENATNGNVVETIFERIFERMEGIEQKLTHASNECGRTFARYGSLKKPENRTTYASKNLGRNINETIRDRYSLTDRRKLIVAEKDPSRRLFERERSSLTGIDASSMDEEMFANARQRKRGRLVRDRRNNVAFVDHNYTEMNARKPVTYSRRGIDERSILVNRHQESTRKRFRPEIIRRRYYRDPFDLVVENMKDSSEDHRPSRRVARNTVWSPKTRRNVGGERTNGTKLCPWTHRRSRQNGNPEESNARKNLETRNFEPRYENWRSKVERNERYHPRPRYSTSRGRNAFVDRNDSPKSNSWRKKEIDTRPEWSYAVTNRGNSTITIEDVAHPRYEDINLPRTLDEEDDFDHVYESVDSDDDISTTDDRNTITATLDSGDLIDTYYDPSNRFHEPMSPTLLEISDTPSSTIGELATRKNVDFFRNPREIVDETKVRLSQRGNRTK